jgi:Fe2+ transport system protein FeoA
MRVGRRASAATVAMTLADASAGADVTFVGAGRIPVPGLFWRGSLGERLAALGFVPGTALWVESNNGRGPVIVRVRGARVAIGRGQAGRMLVRSGGAPK